MKNRIELENLKKNLRTFIIIFLIMLYAMDFLVLANIIVISLVLTKIINYIIERLGA